MYVRKHPTSVEEWRSKSKLVRADIPITYYKHGELEKVLKGWHVENGIPGFHVYRLSDPENFKINFDTFDDSTVRVRGVKDIKNCTAISGTMMPLETNCMDKYVMKFVEGKEVLDGFERNVYGSFTKFADHTMEYLAEAINFPSKFSQHNFEHGFLANLVTPMVTAPIHCNPMTTNMAVQYVGTKSWFFIAAEDFQATDGFSSYPAPISDFPGRAPQRDVMNYRIYDSQPGDVMFFPPGWAHSVITHKGPNIMINFRKFHLKHFLYRPMYALHGMFNGLFFKKFGKNDDFEKTIIHDYANRVKKFAENHPDNIETRVSKLMDQHLKKIGQK